MEATPSSRTRPSSHAATIAALLTACLFVAGATLVTKPVLSEAPALSIVVVQVVASLAMIGPYAMARGKWPRVRSDWRLGLPGLLQPGLSYGFLFAGLALIPASAAGLLFALESGLVALIAWPLLKERPGKAVALSIFGSTGGIVLLTGAGPDGPMIAPLGVVLVLAGVLCAALDTVAARSLAVHADPLTMAVATHIGALVMLAVTLLILPTSWSWVGDLRLLAIVAVAGVVVHGLATILFNIALQRLSAAFAAASFPLISLLVAAGGVSLLGERLEPIQWFGGALVLLSTLVVVMTSSR